MKVNRVMAYVDGFNLYFGIKDAQWKRYYWLNISLLCENLLIGNQTLVKTKYFTARVNHPADKVRRQGAYLEALETLPNLEVIYGRYLSNPYTCKNCGNVHMDSKEKMTDINIAVAMFSDALADNFDVALLVSADSDLVPVVVGFPPQRHSMDLEDVADASFRIFRTSLGKSLFPNPVIRPDGFHLLKPRTWI